MPNTLCDVERIIDNLPQRCIHKLTLLVVPGLAWTPASLERLSRWQELGIQLAGHGWRHECSRIGGLYHYIHSKCFSRRAAEHLALDRCHLKALLNDNYQWFASKKLNPPVLYVPPAWALGDLKYSDLKVSSFQIIESFARVYNPVVNRSRVLPLVGFEADSDFRAAVLALWNKANVAIASDSLPLRIAIHPHDLDLKLKNEIPRILKKVSRFIDYQDLIYSNYF